MVIGRSELSYPPPDNILASDESESAPMNTATRIEIAQLRAFARDVWGSEEAAERFWSEPHPLLGGRTPLEACESQSGARSVELILGRLKFGSAV